MGCGALAVQDGAQTLPGGVFGACVEGWEPGGETEEAAVGALYDAGGRELGWNSGD